MFLNLKKHWLFWLTLALVGVNILIFRFDWQNSHRDFIFAMLDVGQGDALFVQSPTGTQILMDGGPSKKVLSELYKVMSPFDTHIDALIITNPDTDHIAGFLDVLKKYKVDAVFEPGTVNSSKTFENLKREISEKKIKNFLARKDMRIHLGGGAYMDILFPDRDVSGFTTNDGSIVVRLVYGNNSIMLTGDSTTKTEKIILQNYKKEYLQSDILKVGHHGSRTSTGEEFLKSISPQYAFISSGKGNNYGHPHRDVTDLLSSFGVQILRTDQVGTIVFSCDTIERCRIRR